MQILPAFLRRPQRPRGTFRLIALGLAALVAYALGLIWFVANLPGAIEAPVRRTDAIVVLTGGSGRLGEGLELLRRDMAERLFVSGVYRGVDLRELLRVREEDAGNLGQRVDLGHDADNTLGNARETARWMAEHGYSSLRLVTGAYHMPRSLLEFRRLMPQAEIVAHPVFPPHVRQDDWWRWPGTAMLLIGEYTKYLLAQVRIAIHAWTTESGAEQAASG
ncbi:MAG: YdcF family protein [Rhodovibrionaceae bacterium]|nr:YdcF family protein [Rhodovibrionaceae bacterium]